MTPAEELLVEHTTTLLDLELEFNMDFTSVEVTTKDWAKKLGTDWMIICKPVFDRYRQPYINSGMTPP